MGWALLAMKFVPMVVQAVVGTDRKSTRKGRDKQDEAMQLLSQLLTLSQAQGRKRDTDIVNDAETETRALMDAMVAFLNAAQSSEETPPAPR